MKKYLLFTLSFFVSASLYSQQTEFPIHLLGNHIYSNWTINDDIPATVFLESAFPKIVFDEKFVTENLDGLGVELITAPENMSIRMWTSPDKIKVTCFIKDSLYFNGKKIYVDALVADISNRPRDIIFPIYCLDEPVELNISKKSVKIGKPDEKYLSQFYSYDITVDSTYLSPYFNSTLTVYDKKGETETLTGDFLMDLGNSNALVLNRSRKGVPEFVERVDRMMVKDNTRFTPNPAIELGILWPEKFRIENITVTNKYIPVMKLGGRHNFFVGVLGNRFFENFIIVFDTDKVYLKPVSKQVKMHK